MWMLPMAGTLDQVHVPRIMYEKIEPTENSMFIG